MLHFAFLETLIIACAARLKLSLPDVAVKQMLFAGKLLKPNYLLSHYGISKDCVLHVFGNRVLDSEVQKAAPAIASPVKPSASLRAPLQGGLRKSGLSNFSIFGKLCLALISLLVLCALISKSQYRGSARGASAEASEGACTWTGKHLERKRLSILMKRPFYLYIGPCRHHCDCTRSRQSRHLRDL